MIGLTPDDLRRQALQDIVGYLERTARALTARGMFDDLRVKGLIQVDSFGRVHLTRDGRHALKESGASRQTVPGPTVLRT